MRRVATPHLIYKRLCVNLHGAAGTEAISSPAANLKARAGFTPDLRVITAVFCLPLHGRGCGCWIRTSVLRLMGPASFHCSNPQYAICKSGSAAGFILRGVSLSRPYLVRIADRRVRFCPCYFSTILILSPFFDAQSHFIKIPLTLPPRTEIYCACDKTRPCLPADSCTQI